MDAYNMDIEIFILCYIIYMYISTLDKMGDMW